MTDLTHAPLTGAREHQILDAAMTVFADKGFHPTTIRAVARHAGIADGTIYNYFANKEALLLGIFDRLRRTIMAAQPPVAAADAHAQLASLLAHPLNALAADDLALFRVVASQLPVNAELRARYVADILTPTLAPVEAAFTAAAARPDDARLLVHIVSALLLGLLLQRSLGDAVLAARWEALPDVLADMFAPALEATQ